jgi:DNA-binding response OmpR family regulator
MRCLIAQNDPATARLVCQVLQQQQLAADIAADGEQASVLGLEAKYRLIVLDLKLPKLHGATVLRRLRHAGVGVPILILSDIGGVTDRVEALLAGADDFISRPFHAEEFCARIRALLRRPPLRSLELHVSDLDMDCVRHSVTRGGKRIHLSNKEFAVLEYLLRNQGDPIPRAMLVDHVGMDLCCTGNLNVCMSRVRRKVDRGFEKKLIHTIRGVGYVVMNPEPSTIPGSPAVLNKAA